MKNKMGQIRAYIGENSVVAKKEEEKTRGG
jgi:hypothetical protein